MTPRELRSNEVNTLVPFMAQFTEIQEAVHLRLARSAVLGNRAIIDGRGVGNVVYRDMAQIKLFFDAGIDAEQSSKIRALRIIHREFCSQKTGEELLEFQRKYGPSNEIDYEALYRDYASRCIEEQKKVVERDQMDEQIKFAPLKYESEIMDLIVTDSSPEMTLIDILMLMIRKSQGEGLNFLKEKESFIKNKISELAIRRIKMILEKEVFRHSQGQLFPDFLQREIQSLREKASFSDPAFISLLDGNPDIQNLRQKIAA